MTYAKQLGFLVLGAAIYACGVWSSWQVAYTLGVLKGRYSNLAKPTKFVDEKNEEVKDKPFGIIFGEVLSEEKATLESE